ncbi:preprotein translocase subunit Sec61beta [Nanoarchaeota archaeon]
MPSGIGGLVRYFDEYHSKIRFKPGSVVIACIVVMILMILLYSYGGSLIGLA